MILEGRKNMFSINKFKSENMLMLIKKRSDSIILFAVILGLLLAWITVFLRVEFDRYYCLEYAEMGMAPVLGEYESVIFIADSVLVTGYMVLLSRRLRSKFVFTIFCLIGINILFLLMENVFDASRYANELWIRPLNGIRIDVPDRAWYQILLDTNAEYLDLYSYSTFKILDSNGFIMAQLPVKWLWRFFAEGKAMTAASAINYVVYFIMIIKVFVLSDDR